MKTLERVVLPKYSKTEEILNCITHGLGIPMAIVFCILLMAKSVSSSGIVGSLVFVLSALVLYTCSMTYHLLPASLAKKAMRLVDHSVIFIMVMGTVLAVNIICVFPYSKTFSLIDAFISLSLSILGIVLTFIDQEKYKKVQLVLYVVVGATFLAILYPIIKYNNDSRKLIIMLFVGSVVYLVGMALYIVGKKKRYFHSIFHVFVLAGTIIHFLAIYDII